MFDSGLLKPFLEVRIIFELHFFRLGLSFNFLMKTTVLLLMMKLLLILVMVLVVLNMLVVEDVYYFFYLENFGSFGIYHVEVARSSENCCHFRTKLANLQF